MNRLIRMLVCPAVVVGLAAGVLGCGASSQPVASSSGTAALTGGEAAAESVQAMSDYSAALTRWYSDFSMDFEAEAEEALAFDDPANPTESELLRARQLVDAMRASVSSLREISPPPEVAQAHSQLYAALTGELDSLERFVNAIDWGSERDAELAWRSTEEAYGLYVQAVKGLSPYVDLPGMKQN